MTTIDNGEALQGTQSAQQLENESMRLMFTAINQLAVNVSVLVDEVRALRQQSEEKQSDSPEPPVTQDASHELPLPPQSEEPQASEQTLAMLDTPSKQSNDLPVPLSSPVLQQQSQETASESSEIADSANELVKKPQDKPESVILPPELTLNGFGAASDISTFAFTPVKEEQKTEPQITALYAIGQTLTDPNRVRDEAVRSKFSGLNHLIEGAKEIASSITTKISKGIEWLKESFNSRSLAEDLRRQSTVTHFANRLLDTVGHRHEDGRAIVQGTNYRFERDAAGSITITDTSSQQRGELFSAKQGVLVDHLKSSDLNHFLKAAQVLKSQEQQPKGAER